MGKNSFKDRLAQSKESLLNKQSKLEPELKVEEVKEEVAQNEINDNTDVHQPDIIKTIETTTINKDSVVNDTQILPETIYSKLVKSNNLVAKAVRKKQKQKSELDEVFEVFQDMSRNEIVKLFTDDIIMKRDKDIRRKLLSYTKKKPNKFKDRMETFSMPVRPEMKTFLHIVGLFSGNAKYMLFEEIILKGIQQMDFDQDSEFDLDDEEFDED